GGRPGPHRLRLGHDDHPFGNLPDQGGGQRRPRQPGAGGADRAARQRPVRGVPHGPGGHGEGGRHGRPADGDRGGGDRAAGAADGGVVRAQRQEVGERLPRRRPVRQQVGDVLVQDRGAEAGDVRARAQGERRGGQHRQRRRRLHRAAPAGGGAKVTGN